jgi:predicted AlkP superfamily phosphohydrolase/phosphomutase
MKEEIKQLILQLEKELESIPTPEAKKQLRRAIQNAKRFSKTR